MVYLEPGIYQFPKDISATAISDLPPVPDIVVIIIGLAGVTVSTLQIVSRYSSIVPVNIYY